MISTKILTGSLLAIGLFVATAVAQDAPKPEELPQLAPDAAPAQEAPQPVQEAPPAPEAPAAEAPATLPPEVMALIGDSRPPSELSQEELQGRYAQARKYSRMEGITGDVKGQLADMARQARAELMAREQQAKQPEAPQPEAAPQPAPETAKVPEVQPAPETAKVPEAQPAPAPQPEVTAKPAPPKDEGGGAIPPAVVELLRDQRPAASLNDQQLERRLSRLNRFESIDGLPPDALAQIQAMKADAMQEQARRSQAQQPVEQQPVPQQPVADAPPAPARAPAEPPPPPKPPVAEVPLQPQLAPVAPPPPAADSRDVQQLDANKANPETERRAKDMLAEGSAAEQLSDEQLRRRLDDMRAVLSTNELSPGMERELRRQLNTEREILRDRVATAESDRLRRETQQKRPRSRFWAEEAPADWDWSVRDALNDRRRSEDLRTYELRRRLEVYRQAVNDRRYDPEYRNYWRAVIARDQYVLELRLVDLRRKRQAQVNDIYNNNELDFEIGVNVAPEDDVFAAEVDDTELQDVLIAKPRRKFTRRYSVEEIEQSPQLRAALPRVEVDTVRFGFNEAFVRPEEIDKLDRIGEILERILRKNPNEVFLIEGHTDAVGSDAANLALSRKRAEAVKKALTTYFIIPSRALRTVGYGERYLKIPTAEAEAENRRVSVSRATDLVGGLE